MVLNNLQQMAFDSFEMTGSENPLSIPVPLDEESDIDGGPLIKLTCLFPHPLHACI